MARIRFLDTEAVRALKLKHTELPIAMVPTLGAMSRAQIHFGIESARSLPSAAGVVAAIYDALIWSGAKVSMGQVADLRDASALPDELKYLGDFVVNSEPGDPGYVDDETPAEPEAAEDDADVPTGPAGAGVVGTPGWTPRDQSSTGI